MHSQLYINQKTRYRLENKILKIEHVLKTKIDKKGLLKTIAYILG